LKGIVEPLLPPGSSVTVLMKPGRSEHGYEFTPSDLARLLRAGMVIYVGLNLEGKVEQVISESPSERRKDVCFADAVSIRVSTADADASADEHNHAEDAHVHDEHCDHGLIDQHLWLDPVLVKQFVPVLAVTVTDLLKARNADEAELERIANASRSLEARVLEVDTEWTTTIRDLKNPTIVTHHNAFSRPAERYGFTVATSMRIAEGRELGPSDLERVVKTIKSEGVRAIFVEPQFDPRIAQRIARTARVKLGTLDPLGDGDWFKLMASNLEALRSNLQPEESSRVPGR
jgi:ABC-type Zn uptake system ZnuABC Zn-binding protein ZnuA